MNIQGVSTGNLTINQRLFVLIILFIGPLLLGASGTSRLPKD